MSVSLFHCYTPGRSVAVIFSSCGAAPPKRLILRKGSAAAGANKLRAAPYPLSSCQLAFLRLPPPPVAFTRAKLVGAPRLRRLSEAFISPLRQPFLPPPEAFTGAKLVGAARLRRLSEAFISPRLRPSPARSSLVPRGSAAFPKPSSASLPRPSPARSSLVPGGSAAPCSRDYQRNDKEFFRICYIT